MPVRVLLVTPFEEDCLPLPGPDWEVRRTRTYLEAWLALHTSGFHVIVAETGPLWRDLVQEVGELPDAPPVVLMSPVADERLWAEVLNLGAFDLLMKPLNPAEVRWVLEAATRQHERRDVAAAGLQLRFGQNFHV